MQIEKADWYAHKPSDDNKGYIYGIYYIQGEEIEEVEWFKSKTERDKEFQRISKWVNIKYQ